VATVDAGANGARIGRIREVGRAIVGARRIAAFFAAVAREGLPGSVDEREINGTPALLRSVDGSPFSVTLLDVRDGHVRRVFVHADRARLAHVARHTAVPCPV
jgi:hypothetical protein